MVGGAPDTLVEHQHAVAGAIHQLLDGPARRHERAALLDLRAGYDAALLTEAERRHFFELTARRRLAAALLNALLFGVITAVAVQTVEAMPAVNTRALATGAGALGFELRYVRPRQVVRALVGVSGSRINERARAGVNRYPGDVVQEIRQDVADVQDRELRRRIKYELLAERHYGSMVRVALGDALLDAKLTTSEDRRRAVDVAVRTAVEWLYALYGIDLTLDDPLGRRRWR